MWQLIGWLGLIAINLFFHKNHKDDKGIEESSNWLLVPAWKTSDIMFISCLPPKGDHSGA